MSGSGSGWDKNGFEVVRSCGIGPMAALDSGLLHRCPTHSLTAGNT